MIIIKKNMIINQLNISLFFIYFFIQLFIAPKNNYSLISSINTILTASIANYLFITDYEIFINIYNYKINEVNILYSYPPILSTSYVLFDLYYSFNPFKIDMILHGTLLLLSIILVEYYEINHYMCPAFLIQTSTLFLNYVKKSNIYGFLFFITFFIYRIIIFPIFTTKFLSDKYDIILNYNFNYEQLVSILVLFINLLNFYWFKKIVKIFLNKINVHFLKTD